MMGLRVSGHNRKGTQSDSRSHAVWTGQALSLQMHLFRYIQAGQARPIRQGTDMSKSTTFNHKPTFDF